MKLYKITNANGSSCHGGVGTWQLPKGKRPGAWWCVEGKLVPCENGLHLCRQSDLLKWLGPVIWEAEHRGELIINTDKVIVRQARLIRKCSAWNNQTARLFAADCAERTLEIANDERCNAAILATRQYTFGLIDDAAWTAARDAAWAAALDAAEDAGDATGDAAWAAIGAARATAWAAEAAWATAEAARVAAEDAECKWQEKRLTQYLTGQVDLDEIRELVS